MFIKFTVLILAIALFSVLFHIIRERSKLPCENDNKRKFKDRTDWAEPLENLTLEQLRQKLKELKCYKNSLTSGFVNKNAVEQDKILAQVTRLNGKIEKVKAAIIENHFVNQS